MKSAILLPIIVVLVVVAAVAVIDITGVNPFQKPSEGGVVETALTELFDTKVFHVDGRIEADIQALLGDMQGEGSQSVLSGVSSVKMFVSVSSDVDQRKQDNFKTSSDINLGVDAGGLQLTGIMEAVTVGGSLYVKLTSIPPMLTAFLGDIESIKDQWIEIDLGELKDQYQGITDQAGVTIEGEQVSEELEELFDEMKELLSGKTLFDITRELGEEEVGEILTEHYFVTANKEAITELILEYIELTREYVLPDKKAEYDSKIDEAMQDFPEKFDEFWTSIDGIEFDIWVQKRTGRLVRILWQKDIGPSSIGDMPEEIENVGVKVDFSFSDFNKKIDIEAPTGSKPLEEILSGIMSTLVPQGLEAPALPEGF